MQRIGSDSVFSNRWAHLQALLDLRSQTVQVCGGDELAVHLQQRPHALLHSSCGLALAVDNVHAQLPCQVYLDTRHITMSGGNTPALTAELAASYWMIFRVHSMMSGGNMCHQ